MLKKDTVNIMRTATVERNTKETQIKAELNLDGGEVSISTGIGFFDHMLTAFAVHGGFGLKLNVNGDLDVDTHHTVEDTGIVLGTAFKQALGDMSGIERYGTFFIPMDESLAQASLPSMAISVQPEPISTRAQYSKSSNPTPQPTISAIGAGIKVNLLIPAV